MFNFGTNRGRSTTPKVLENATSLCNPVLPELVPSALALTTLEAKDVGLYPAIDAAQLAARVAGTGPWLTKFLSQGSLANEKTCAVGRNNSVIDGARMDFVLL